MKRVYLSKERIHEMPFSETYQKRDLPVRLSQGDGFAENLSKNNQCFGKVHKTGNLFFFADFVSRTFISEKFSTKPSNWNIKIKKNTLKTCINVPDKG